MAAQCLHCGGLIGAGRDGERCGCMNPVEAEDGEEFYDITSAASRLAWTQHALATETGKRQAAEKALIKSFNEGVESASKIINGWDWYGDRPFSDLLKEVRALIRPEK